MTFVYSHNSHQLHKSKVVPFDIVIFFLDFYSIVHSVSLYKLLLLKGSSPFVTLCVVQHYRIMYGYHKIPVANVDGLCLCLGTAFRKNQTHSELILTY